MRKCGLWERPHESWRTAAESDPRGSPSGHSLLLVRRCHGAMATDGRGVGTGHINPGVLGSRARRALPRLLLAAHYGSGQLATFCVARCSRVPLGYGAQISRNLLTACQATGPSPSRAAGRPTLALALSLMQGSGRATLNSSLRYISLTSVLAHQSHPATCLRVALVQRGARQGPLGGPGDTATPATFVSGLALPGPKFVVVCHPAHLNVNGPAQSQSAATPVPPVLASSE
jgi:hypothetical protein